MLGTPPIDCEYCYPTPPTVRLQKAGDSIDRTKPLIDTDSELNNRHRPASKCPENRLFSDNEIPQGGHKIRPALRPGGVIESYENYETIEETAPENNGYTHWKDCFDDAIESRTVDPPSNLRGTGFDRWEYLCFNPQEKATVPFDYNISNRILVKDNHRPCVPKPLDQKLVLPKNSGKPTCEKTTPVCSAPTHPASVPCKKHAFYSS
tara:strand:+ start:1491 stop:2111 length:621 start_codon:yes stop_codon:yes gene_type:complete